MSYELSEDERESIRYDEKVRRHEKKFGAPEGCAACDTPIEPGTVLCDGCAEIADRQADEMHDEIEHVSHAEYGDVIEDTFIVRASR